MGLVGGFQDPKGDYIGPGLEQVDCHLVKEKVEK
jgi:hypothetical protein